MAPQDSSAGAPGAQALRRTLRERPRAAPLLTGSRESRAKLPSDRRKQTAIPDRETDSKDGWTCGLEAPPQAVCSTVSFEALEPLELLRLPSPP